MTGIWNREIWLLVSALQWTCVALNRSLSFLGLYFPTCKKEPRGLYPPWSIGTGQAPDGQMGQKMTPERVFVTSHFGLQSH